MPQGLGRGSFFVREGLTSVAAPSEPSDKRVVAFIDGQNLFHAAREVFGHDDPNYDPLALSRAVCAAQKWKLVQTRFYTGIPERHESPFWNLYWAKKLSIMGKRGVLVYSRSLRYRETEIKLRRDATIKAIVAEEKGIDVRIAVELIRLANEKTYDMALIFSQDQDLTEAVEEVKSIARAQGRWIGISSAFPYSARKRPLGEKPFNARGIDRTKWIQVDEATYDTCLDPTDYRTLVNTELRESGGR
jgi:uncharacterized LabA/DUF88 family protein